MIAPPRNAAPRLLLYSHDSYGLGHLRRSVTLATELVGRIPGAEVLIVTGSPCATSFAMPRGVDVLKLPSATKDAGGAYVARSLHENLDRLVQLRSHVLLETYRAFDPHLVLVDHQPTGLRDELEPLLFAAQKRGTRTILGIRDIIDDPSVVAREWSRAPVRRALTELYDRICVYGDPRVFDARTEYPVPPELGSALHFVGYVVRETRSLPFRALPSLRPEVVVTTGGGEDGLERVDGYVDMLEAHAVDWNSTLVLGPLADPTRARRLKRRVAERADVRVHRFYEDMPRLLAGASAVVAMAGYNTVTELLQARVPTVLLPRCFPRREQLLRATRLAELGLARCLARPTSETLHAAIAGALESGRVVAPLPALDGVTNLAREVEALLGIPETSAPVKEAVST